MKTLSYTSKEKDLIDKMLNKLVSLENKYNIQLLKVKKMDNLERMKEEIEELRESNRIMRERNEKKEKLST